MTYRFSWRCIKCRAGLAAIALTVFSEPTLHWPHQTVSVCSVRSDSATGREGHSLGGRGSSTLRRMRRFGARVPSTKHRWPLRTCSLTQLINLAEFLGCSRASPLHATRTREPVFVRPARAKAVYVGKEAPHRKPTKDSPMCNPSRDPRYPHNLNLHPSHCRIAKSDTTLTATEKVFYWLRGRRKLQSLYTSRRDGCRRGGADRTHAVRRRGAHQRRP